MPIKNAFEVLIEIFTNDRTQCMKGVPHLDAIIGRYEDSAHTWWSPTRDLLACKALGVHHGCNGDHLTQYDICKHADIRRVYRGFWKCQPLGNPLHQLALGQEAVSPSAADLRHSTCSATMVSETYEACTTRVGGRGAAWALAKL